MTPADGPRTAVRGNHPQKERTDMNETLMIASALILITLATVLLGAPFFERYGRLLGTR
jgi:hypothetical protein